MDARISSLESKKSSLKRASYWAGIFGRLTYFWAMVCFAHILLWLWSPEMAEIMAKHVFVEGSVPLTPTEMFLETLENGIMGWWLLAVRDAFQAIIDMIDELSETV